MRWEGDLGDRGDRRNRFGGKLRVHNDLEILIYLPCDLLLGSRSSGHCSAIVVEVLSTHF